MTKGQGISEPYSASTKAATDDDWPLFDRPGFLVRRIHQIHVSLFSELCEPFGVTPLQYSLMSALSTREEADQTTLSGIVALDRTTTTGALKRLEARGFVQRCTSTTDRRSQSCRLTPEGRGILAAMEQAARRAHAATVEVLSPGEQHQLIDLMKKIVNAHESRAGHPDLH